MCEHCKNITGWDCPVCGRDESPHPKPEIVQIEVTHCKNCKFGIYHMARHYEQYDCNHPAYPEPRRTLIAYNSEYIGIDEQPLPADCPLKSQTIVIKLTT